MPLVLPKPGDAQKAGQRRAAEMSWQGKLQKKSEEHRTPLQQYAAAHTAQQQTDASSLLGEPGQGHRKFRTAGTAQNTAAPPQRPTGFRSFLNSFSLLQ